jgi:hypothetical protein
VHRNIKSQQTACKSGGKYKVALKKDFFISLKKAAHKN